MRTTANERMCAHLEGAAPMEPLPSGHPGLVLSALQIVPEKPESRFLCENCLIFKCWSIETNTMWERENTILVETKCCRLSLSDAETCLIFGSL